MKILTIGLSGVGKTSFLSCMYGHFQESRYGITLCKAGDKALLQNFEKIQKNRYPERTVKRSEHRMEICSKYCEPCSVIFVDYAGNIFDEREKCGKSEIEMFHRDCMDFDGIICFIEQKNFDLCNMSFSRTIQILSQIVSAGRKRNVPIEFIVTKCDRTRIAISDLKRMLHSLLNMSEINPALYFAVFQVSCSPNCSELLEPPVFFLFLFVYSKGRSNFKKLWMKQDPMLRFTKEFLCLCGSLFMLDSRWNKRFLDFYRWHFAILENDSPIIRRLAGELLVPAMKEIKVDDLYEEIETGEEDNDVRK